MAFINLSNIKYRGWEMGKKTTEQREKMESLRINFAKALGLKWPDKNPNCGYKYEMDPKKRQQFIDEAIEFRAQYAELVTTTGEGGYILAKMDNNIKNRDHSAIWK